MGINISHYKDPYLFNQPVFQWKVDRSFFGSLGQWVDGTCWITLQGNEEPYSHLSKRNFCLQNCLFRGYSILVSGSATFYWSNYSGRKHEFLGPQKVASRKGNPLYFRENPGLWNSIVWPDILNLKITQHLQRNIIWTIHLHDFGFPPVNSPGSVA